MNRHDGLGSLGHCGPNQSRIQIEAVRLDINEHRYCPNQSDAFSRCKEGEGTGNDFVPWANTKCAKANNQCVSTGIQPNGVLCTKKRCHLGLEFPDLMTKHEAALVQHSGNSGVKLTT